MADEFSIRLAVLESEAKAHEKSDDERYARIESNSQQVLALITELGRKLDTGFNRVHERIDAEVNERKDAVSGMKNKLLGTMVTVLLAAVAFFVVPFFSKGAQ